MTPYPYRIVVGWSEEDQAYVARVPALPGAGGDGPSETAAIESVKASSTAIIAVMKKHGDLVPASDLIERKFSGQLRLRLPPSLHRKLSEDAEAEGVSLNQLMVAYLAAEQARRSIPRSVYVVNVVPNPPTEWAVSTGAANTSEPVPYHVPQRAKAYEH